jgi:transcriptional regulator with XRE-family HTH domain
VHVPEQGTSVGSRRLAAELRRLREHAGLTGEEVSEQLGWSGSKLSRIELHRIGVKQADLRKLLALYGVTEGHRDDLLALNRESGKKGRLVRATGGFPQVAGYMAAEAEAESVWNWEPQVVPGLLQTWGYARALRQLWLGMFPGPQSETDRWADTRLMRQQVLTRDPPLDLSVVIDESVLRRRFGDKAVMCEQLQHLVASSELPNVEVRIYPLDSDSPAIGTGAFSYMQFPQVHDVPLHDIVSVEHHEGTYDLEDEEETFKYRVAFEYLKRGSLDPERSRALISATMVEIWA